MNGPVTPEDSEIYSELFSDVTKMIEEEIENDSNKKPSAKSRNTQEHLDATANNEMNLVTLPIEDNPKNPSLEERNLQYKIGETNTGDDTPNNTANPNITPTKKNEVHNETSSEPHEQLNKSPKCEEPNISEQDKSPKNVTYAHPEEPLNDVLSPPETTLTGPIADTQTNLETHQNQRPSQTTEEDNPPKKETYVPPEEPLNDDLPSPETTLTRPKADIQTNPETHQNQMPSQTTEEDNPSKNETYVPPKEPLNDALSPPETTLTGPTTDTPTNLETHQNQSPSQTANIDDNSNDSNNNTTYPIDTYIDEPSIKFVYKFSKVDDIQEVKNADNSIKSLINFIHSVKINNALDTDKRRRAIHRKIAEVCSSILDNNRICRESKNVITAIQNQTSTVQGLYYVKSIKKFRCRHNQYTREALLKKNYEPVYLDIVEACQRLQLLNWKGACRNDVCPMKFRTKVKLINPMEGQQLCFGYSTANVLDYIGYPEAASIVRNMSWLWSCISYDQVIERLEAILKVYIPHICQPTVYGSILTKKKKRKQEITLGELINSRDNFPWLVIPTFPDGTSSHVLWMIDDLIVDTLCNKALKRTLPVFDW